MQTMLSAKQIFGKRPDKNAPPRTVGLMNRIMETMYDLKR